MCYFKPNFIHCSDGFWTAGVAISIHLLFWFYSIIFLLAMVAGDSGEELFFCCNRLNLQELVWLNALSIWKYTEYAKVPFFSLLQTKCSLFKLFWRKKMKDARWQMLSVHCLANTLNKYHKVVKTLSTGTHSTEAQSRKTNKELALHSW